MTHSQHLSSANKNVEIFNILMAEKQIRINRGRLFDTTVAPKPIDFDFAKVEGMLLGIAIGDSLGVPTESLLPAVRRARHGEIKHYIPNRHTTEARGFPSDDTQLAFWTLEQLIQDKGYNPKHVAHRIANGGRIFGLGSTVREFLSNYKSNIPWQESGPDSAGNGALMRIAPILLPHLRTGGTELWVDTTLAAMTTHNSFASNSACLAFVAMLWDLLDRKREAPSKRWWMDRYVELTMDLEGDSGYKPRGGCFMDFEGPLWQYVQKILEWADSQNLSTLDACNAWNSGAYLLETVPCVLYILMRYAHDPEEAMVRAVNDTKDNDTVAAIVGAALGALYGQDAFPARWVSDLSGRTTLDDDGRVFELIKEARSEFWGA